MNVLVLSTAAPLALAAIAIIGWLLEAPRGRQHVGSRLTAEGAKRCHEIVPADDQRIVVDEERAEGRNGLGDPGEGLLLDQVLEREGPGIGLMTDLVRELHRQCEVPARQEAGLGIDPHRSEGGE